MAKKRNKIILLVTILISIVVAGALLYLKRDDLSRIRERAMLPEAKPYQASTLPATAAARATSTPLAAKPGSAKVPAEINLAVPFTPQAPYGHWVPPYKEFCEEASVLMAVSYLKGEALPTAADADQKMLAIKAFENKRFGYYEDTTAAETAVILREYYKIERVALVENPSTDDFKSALAKGKLVIMPAAGRLLGNPYFTPPGPLYHMLVIKGYTAQGKFITNDPGTRRGADFLYSPATLLNAMHDWRPDGQVELGRKVVIIVG